ncbi:minor capsid protein [Capybara microvirus Cap1_SP_116]|nr:minor capsid protein [Capybara microvirus Cap1_SP_116]
MPDLSNHAGSQVTPNPVTSGPYSVVNTADQLSGWNRLTDWLGVTNHQGQINNQLALQQSLLDDERAYNDPAAQVERLRNAGINPDLLGGVSSYESTGQGANPLSQPTGDFGNFILGVAQTFSGVASGILDLQSKALDNDIKRASLFDTESILNRIASDRSISADFIEAMKDPNRLKPAVSLDQYVNLSTIRSKKVRKAVEDNFYSKLYSDDFIQRINGLLTGVNKSERDFSESVAGLRNPSKTADSLIDALAEFMSDAYTTQMSANKAERHHNDASISQDDYNKMVTDALDPSNESDAITAGFEASETSKKKQSNIDSVIEEFTGKMKKKDTWWSDLILAIMAMYQSGAFDSFGFSRSSQSSFTPRGGSQERSSFNFHL